MPQNSAKTITTWTSSQPYKPWWWHQASAQLQTIQHGIVGLDTVQATSPTCMEGGARTRWGNHGSCWTGHGCEGKGKWERYHYAMTNIRLQPHSTENGLSLFFFSQPPHIPPRAWGVGGGHTRNHSWHKEAGGASHPTRQQAVMNGL